MNGSLIVSFNFLLRRDVLPGSTSIMLPIPPSRTRERMDFRKDTECLNVVSKFIHDLVDQWG